MRLPCLHIFSEQIAGSPFRGRLPKRVQDTRPRLCYRRRRKCVLWPVTRANGIGDRRAPSVLWDRARTDHRPAAGHFSRDRCADHLRHSRGGASSTSRAVGRRTGVHVAVPALFLYTAAFIAEMSGPYPRRFQGQTEAAHALGIRPGADDAPRGRAAGDAHHHAPLTSQYLNLTRTRRWAVAIGYADLVAVGGTILNQTGQSIEIVSIWLIVYLRPEPCDVAVHELVQRRMALGWRCEIMSTNQASFRSRFDDRSFACPSLESGSSPGCEKICSPRPRNSPDDHQPAHPGMAGAPAIQWLFIDAAWTGGGRGVLPRSRKAARSRKAGAGAAGPSSTRNSPSSFGRYRSMSAGVRALVGILFVLLLVPMLIPRIPYKGLNALLLPGRPAYPCGDPPARRWFGLTYVETPLWGGLMVTLVLLRRHRSSAPLGILLALGRRSNMPVIKMLLHRLHRSHPRRSIDHGGCSWPASCCAVSCRRASLSTSSCAPDRVSLFGLRLYGGRSYGGSAGNSERPV